VRCLARCVAHVCRAACPVNWRRSVTSGPVTRPEQRCPGQRMASSDDAIHVSVRTTDLVGPFVVFRFRSKTEVAHQGTQAAQS